MLYRVSRRRDDPEGSEGRHERSKGMTVEPASGVSESGGHHHLLINVERDCARRGHLFLAETLIGLPPSEHILSLQFTNGQHEFYGEERYAARPW